MPLRSVFPHLPGAAPCFAHRRIGKRPGLEVLEDRLTPSGDVLVVTQQPPASVTAGATFGLEVKAEDGQGNVDFRRGMAESLPVESGWADLVNSNGVLNLAACKADAFREVARALKPGGRFQAVDLVLAGELLPEVMAHGAGDGEVCLHHCTALSRRLCGESGSSLFPLTRPSSSKPTSMSQSGKYHQLR